jgi:hypothetical protein
MPSSSVVGIAGASAPARLDLVDRSSARDLTRVNIPLSFQGLRELPRAGHQEKWGERR